VKRLLEQAMVTEGTNHSRPISKHKIDLGKLETALQSMDPNQIRQRRALYNRLYHEARLSFERGRGISFTNMLLMLAHNKLIADKEALSVKEFLARQETMKMVSDAVNVDKVESLLKMIYHRRRFLRMTEEKRLSLLSAAVPHIIVEPMPSLQLKTVSDPSLDSDSASHRAHREVDELSPNSDGRQSRRFSDISMLSETEHRRSSRESSVQYSTPNINKDNVLTALESSPWKDLMIQTEEEED